MLKSRFLPIEQLYPILLYQFVTGELPSKRTYDDRLLWQKIGYLAQQLGASLDDYQFNWYKAGPYSPAYTSLLYDVSGNEEELYNEYELSSEIQKDLEPLKLIFNYAPEVISIPKWFELMASILYIKKNTGLNKESVFKSLKRKKPFFDNDQLNEYAWNILKKLNMI